MSTEKKNKLIRSKDNTNSSNNANSNKTLEFMEFKNRINRLMKELLKHRPKNENSVWGKQESVEMKLEANQVKLNFLTNWLNLSKITALFSLFEQLFEKSNNLNNTNINFSSCNNHLIKKIGNTELHISPLLFSDNMDEIEVNVLIEGFTQHFEYFINEVVKLIYPEVEEAYENKKKEEMNEYKVEKPYENKKKEEMNEHKVEKPYENKKKEEMNEHKVEKPYENKKKEKMNEHFEGWYYDHGRELENLGCHVVLDNSLTWNDLVGLDDIKQALQTNILIPLQREKLFQKITKKVSPHPISIMPRGVLLYGPPGVGKTWSLKVLGTIAQLPVIILPCQALMSKWYGESEKIISSIFQKLKNAGKVILLIDELDSIARKREGAHESTARVISILLTEMDGLTEKGEILLMASANNTELIDPAILDRFDIKLKFSKPDKAQLNQVLQYYVRHLNENQINQITNKMDGWNFRSLAKFTEEVLRSFVSSLDLNLLETGEPPLPRLEDYLKTITNIAFYGNSHRE